MLRPEERIIFEAFCHASPDFAGRSVSWHPGNDPPDILCVDQSEKRIGIELAEWLNEQQIRSRIEQERLEASYLETIRSRDVQPPQNIGFVSVSTKIGMRLDRCDASEFRKQLYELVDCVDKRWHSLDAHDSPQGLSINDFSQYPYLKKYLQSLRFHSRSDFNWPVRVPWIIFPTTGGPYTPKTAIDALLTVLAKKTGMYGDLHQKENLDELYLIIYYNKALIYNSPFQIPGLGFREIADSLSVGLDGNHGAFQRVFLFNAIKQDQQAILVWPRTQKGDLQTTTEV